MTTLIMIILQDIYFFKQRQTLKLIRNNINTISMKQFTPVSSDTQATSSRNEYQSLKFIDKAFEGEQKSVEEDLYFDVRQYKNKSEVRDTVNQTDVNIPDLILDRQDETLVPENKSLLENFIEKNLDRLILVFIVILIAQFIASTIIMLASVTYSHFKLITLLTNPMIIIASLVFKNYSCKFF